ncbi:hypothetical protein HJC23_001900 [Cyclotella cryptica]|uniref:SET domain-containing protein n=1 Tax=Cyclotella cryptica TaxID=29204 RepID=A0ABD3NMS0_9STRA|eukprot:CCRYP_020532-RA/>CCRYP_020532-RA protein AED:0.04 eAED:0.04 QI:0/-1/0/1/-1/1/1/0/420
MLVALLLWSSLHIANSDATALPTDEHGDYNGSDLIEWINSHPQGYVHPSLRIGRRIPGDSSSIIGTFVSSAPGAKPIEKDEVIATIPWDRMIGPGDEYSPTTFGSCQAIRNLASELKLGDNSQYAPYVRYLLTQSIEAMPGEWSKAGQMFLRQITADGELPPLDADWFEAAEYKNVWLNACRGSDDSIGRLAYYLTSNRDEDTLMIPIYDMMNHSNDPDKLNTLSYKPNKVGDSFVFRASRRINPSEEIFNCYNRCHACSTNFREECETYSFRGTPDIFAHYGFVEEIPHYWWFDCNEGHQVTEIEFCLEKIAATGELSVSWINSTPGDHDKAFFVKHLERLKQIESNKEGLEGQLVQPDSENATSQEKMSRLEWEACWKYHNALITAIDAAIVSLNRIRRGSATAKLIVHDEYDIGDEL